MTLEEILEKLHSPTEHAITLENGELTALLEELKQWRRVYGVCPSYEMCIPECREGYDAQIAEYKRLLKAAVEEFREINSDILTCKYCRWYSAEIDECAYPDNVPCGEVCGWKHEAEALKLIGGD